MTEESILRRREYMRQFRREWTKKKREQMKVERKANPFKTAVIELTKADFIKYRQYMEILKNTAIPMDVKKDAALFIKCINDAMEKYKQVASERDFIILYNRMVLDKYGLEIGKIINRSATVVNKRLPKIIEDFARVLYSQLF